MSLGWLYRAPYAAGMSSGWRYDTQSRGPSSSAYTGAEPKACMRGLTWVSLLAAILLLTLLPLLLWGLIAAGLDKLGLSPRAAVALLIAMIAGGFINIPIRRIAHEEAIAVHPLAIFGFSDIWPQLRRVRRETIICVNVGGCLIPLGLAIYELVQLAGMGRQSLFGVAIAAAVNCIVCYLVARPTPGVGIVMPALISPLTAALLAEVLAPDQAPPIAFVAGVLGPLVGADVFHLRDIRKGPMGIVSIGGAGTFDGILLSGILAAYLA